MSRYQQEIDILTGWFANRLSSLPPLVMREEDYQIGIDRCSTHPLEYKIGVNRLEESPHAALIREAQEHWNAERKYELSYNQLNVAFFDALKRLDRLTLIYCHPVFHLGTMVTVKEVHGRGTRYLNVPGHLSSFEGERAVITLDLAIESDRRPGQSCVIIPISQLDEALALRLTYDQSMTVRPANPV